jgi:hypothetical protein
MLTAAANPGAQEQPNRAAEQADDQRLDDALQHDGPPARPVVGAQRPRRRRLRCASTGLRHILVVPANLRRHADGGEQRVLVHFGNRQRVLFEDPNLVILDARPSAASTRLTAPLVAV